MKNNTYKKEMVNDKGNRKFKKVKERNKKRKKDQVFYYSDPFFFVWYLFKSILKLNLKVL